MAKCSICNKISATGDHTDCKEKLRIDLEDKNFKDSLLEKLDIAKDAELAPEVKVILEYLTKEKD
ncbi:MAG: hypothetical protein R1F52_03460 [Candidatus Nitrosoabyssus spongiisocia]|nr:MAG: hypothetical protein R1F52_03460 [Nitrosopumilaceae archaeon AB1(1)]